MKKTLQVLLIVICLAWIGFTLLAPFPPLGSVGELLTYSTGAYSVENDETSGELNLHANGFSNITIHVDSYGVPHIYGKHSRDVCFGMGYMQAKDRLFQMEVMTRLVQGQLSGLLDYSGVESDKQWLLYDMDRLAKNAFEKLKYTDPKTHQDLEAYAKGVNFYLENLKQTQLPPEYKLMRAKPRKWEAYYAMLLSYYMSDVLTHYNGHAERQQLLDKLSPGEMNDLFFHDTTAYPYAIDGDFSNNSALLADFPVSQAKSPALSCRDFVDRQIKNSIGSNHWAVGADQSKDGAALLSNDTHLNLALPGAWYEAHLVCDEYETQGLTLPCSPYVVSGTNEYVSWGITNANWDLTEKFHLEINPKDSTKYRFNGRWVSMTSKTYQISLSDGSTVPFKADFTVNGAVAIEENKKVVNYWYPVEENTSVTSFRKLATTKNWSDFKEALRSYSYPSQNFAYADTKGNVGMISAGKLPARPATYNGGMLDGSKVYTPQFVPFDSLPMQFRGKKGFVFSANQNPARTAYYINYDWPERYRAQRIKDLLSSKDQLDISDMMRFQGDIRDISTHDLKTAIKKHRGSEKDWQLLDPLLNWNGEIDHKSYEAVLLFYFNFILQEEIKTNMTKNIGVGPAIPLSNLYALLKRDKLKFGGQEVKTSAFLLQIIRKTKQQFITDYGIDFRKKASFTTHGVMTIEHFLGFPGMGEWVYNAGGNSQTVNVNVNKTHGPSMRTNFKMTTPVTGYIAIAGGQSGRPDDKNYKDQLTDWKKVRYHKIQLGAREKELVNIQSVIRFK